MKRDPFRSISKTERDQSEVTTTVPVAVGGRATFAAFPTDNDAFATGFPKES